MKYIFTKYLSFLVLIITLFSCSDYSSAIKSKLEDLKDIRETIDNKRNKAIKHKDNFKSQAEELQKGLVKIKKDKHITNYSQVKNDLSLRLKLQTFQRKSAYYKRFYEMEKELNKGLIEADFTIEDFNDKVVISEDFSEEDLMKIIGDINNLTENYIPLTEEKLLNLTPENLPTLEESWDNAINLTDLSKIDISFKINRVKIAKKKKGNFFYRIYKWNSKHWWKVLIGCVVLFFLFLYLEEDDIVDEVFLDIVMPIILIVFATSGISAFLTIWF